MKALLLTGLQTQVGWTVSGGSAPPAIAVPQASPVAGFGLGPNFIADAAAKAAPAVVSVSAQPTSNQLVSLRCPSAP